MARAKLYGRIGKQIVAAVKKGGPSENSNAALASVLNVARLSNIPKELIDRNIKKASEKDQARCGACGAAPRATNRRRGGRTAGPGRRRRRTTWR